MTRSFLSSTRRWFACAVALAAVAASSPLSTSSAFAADLAVRPAASVVRSHWTGFYIGFHGGGGWGNTSIEDPNFQLTFEAISLKSNGWLAGIQVGADWQFGNLVVGGEIDVSRAAIKGTGGFDPVQFPLSGFSTEFRGLATATGRVGYAVGGVLGYVKGGVAWADIDVRNRIHTEFPLSVEHHRTGFVVGTGLEVLLFGNVSARAEYAFMYFGSTAMSLGAPQGPTNVDHALHLVKGGFNLRFGGDYFASRL